MAITIQVTDQIFSTPMFSTVRYHFSSTITAHTSFQGGEVLYFSGSYKMTAHFLLVKTRGGGQRVYLVPHVNENPEIFT